MERRQEVPAGDTDIVPGGENEGWIYCLLSEGSEKATWPTKKD
jgi:hypothetical protein